MKKLWIFVLGAAASSTLLTGAVVATVFWAIVSVIVNGGHPWPYDKSWLLGRIPAGFFILFAATVVFLFRKSPFVINSLKQLIFYLGMLFGAAAFAGVLFLLVTFAKQMPH
ncbi:MAG: hypothetical protein E7056_07415 [Lentisphaerae bacterium]|nr:hypothetical protein [Lentisphaerota bacterium]